MALEELIVAWSEERPSWQREVMRRVAAGEVLSDADYDKLLSDILSAKEFQPPYFGLQNLPQSALDDQPVSILGIQNPEHVNALESSESLLFEPLGLTVVYGDNGSGKSGYARLLKRITRARHHEDVLTDVFRDSVLVKPTAGVRIRTGDVEESFVWPDVTRPELQRILFYDASCGAGYVANESDFPYRPSALSVLDGLIQACVALRSRIDQKLAENGASANTLPFVPELARESNAAKFLTSLSASSSADVLDSLITGVDGQDDVIKELADREAQLRSADTTQARQQLLRQSEKLDHLGTHLEGVNEALGSNAVAEIRVRQRALQTLEDAQAKLAGAFESEPLSGVGSSGWRSLWEAARTFSRDHAYRDREFPWVEDGARCVFCQQSLESEGRDRLRRFDDFVRNDIEVQRHEATLAYKRLVESLQNLTVVPAVVTTNLKDLETAHKDLIAEVRELLATCEVAVKDICDALLHQRELPTVALEVGSVRARLAEASVSAKVSAEDLTKPEAVQKQLAAVATERAERELLMQLKSSRAAIVNEIARLRERSTLENAKSAAATTGITKKVLELSEESITDVVRDTFTRETDRLCLERVTISRTRADKGSVLHQPKLVGARQQTTVPKVFSEGERTALGLAAFFTEAQLEGSRSAVILDDPVTSLDHIRRGLVAARLVALGENRQVILFTHDVAFVGDLKREASARGMQIAERCVTRSRSGDRKPGVCTKSHPWKAKDVAARIDELKRELRRIEKECGTWSEQQYEEAVAVWAGNLSETWERIFSQEVVGPILAEGGLEVRPTMVKVLARFSDDDHREFEGSYSRTSQWAKRHDKSAAVNYVAPEVGRLDDELRVVEGWFKRVKSYKNY